LILACREIPGTGEYRFRRLYKALGLQVRPRKRRKVNYVRGNAISTVSRPNERWSIDFMHDSLGNGRTYRTMNIVDDFTSECLALEPAFSFGSHDVTRCFEEIAFERGLPTAVRFDNELSTKVNPPSKHNDARRPQSRAGTPLPKCPSSTQ
jgi:putative transposase